MGLKTTYGASSDWNRDHLLQRQQCSCGRLAGLSTGTTCLFILPACLCFAFFFFFNMTSLGSVCIAGSNVNWHNRAVHIKNAKNGHSLWPNNFTSVTLPWGNDQRCSDERNKWRKHKCPTAVHGSGTLGHLCSHSMSSSRKRLHDGKEFCNIILSNRDYKILYGMGVWFF